MIFVELDDRAGPAVRDHERERVRVLRARVDEVDALPVDLRRAVLVAVELRLARRQSNLSRQYSHSSRTSPSSAP